jgi:peptidoglycan/xylan/chitin deacetylase (PgdA/CDA1 family)
MKKLLVLLVLLVAGYFGLRKWSPQTLDRLTFWKKAEVVAVVPSLPPPEPAPKLQPQPPPGSVAARVAPAAPRANPDGTPAPEAPPAIKIDKTAQVVAFCYHRVEGAAGGSLSIAPQLFEEHMQKLKDNGITVISMQDFLAWRRGEKSIPAKSALITLDDGYVSAYEVARPILKKFGYPWTYFIYLKYVNSGGKSITWEQLEELRDEGVEIGCHSVSHVNLRNVPLQKKSPEAYEQWLKDEIIGAKQHLEQKLGIKCLVYAYPEGKYNARVLELVKEANYQAAFTVYGQRITHGAAHDKIGRYAWNGARPQDLVQAFAFTGPISASDEGDSAQPASSSMVTQPADGETISNPRPLLKVNLATLGNFDPASVTVRLSGVGLIRSELDRATKILEATPTDPLKLGEYTVTVSAKVGGKRTDTHWRFTVVKDSPADVKPGTQ